MIACVDVDYRDDAAVAAGLWFPDWGAAAASSQVVATFPPAAEYEPGAFYRRELPCLLGLLALGPPADLVIVDGYAWLGDGVAGLGAHLHASLGVTVVGVAKTRFASATDAAAVCRGGSRSPLYVSAAGMAPAEAAKLVAAMHGPYRVPTLLKAVDALARTSPADPHPSTPTSGGRAVKALDIPWVAESAARFKEWLVAHDPQGVSWTRDAMKLPHIHRWTVGWIAYESLFVDRWTEPGFRDGVRAFGLIALEAEGAIVLHEDGQNGGLSVVVGGAKTYGLVAFLAGESLAIRHDPECADLSWDAVSAMDHILAEYRNR